jgi:hypothetical protein
VHISLAHEAHYFEELVADELAGAAHDERHNVFLEHDKAWLVYIVEYIVCVAVYRFALLALLIFVVGEGVLTKSLLDDVLDYDGDK